MNQFNRIVKTMFVVMALVFTSASAAQAQGKVNFSFSIQIGNGHQKQVFTHNNGKFQQFISHNKYKKNKHKKKKHFRKLKTKKQVVRHLRKAGFRHIRKIYRQGNKWITARAITRHGHRVKVKINKRNGRIYAKRHKKWRRY